jgi:hypothetical protein
VQVRQSERRFEPAEGGSPRGLLGWLQRRYGSAQSPSMTAAR